MPADTLPPPSTDEPAPASSGQEAHRPADVHFKTPTLLQMEAVECGAACLGILLNYYGRYVPLEQLRLDCGVSRDGSKAINMVKAARRYGLRAQGSKQELPAVFGMTRPLILFWNFNHFVVLEGFRGGRVFLNDPATGPRVVSLDELDAAFTGVVLEVEPGPDFRANDEKPSLWPALLRRLANSRAAFAYVLLCTVLLVVPGLVIPTFSRIFVDEYLIGGHEDWVRPLLLGMALTAVLRMLISYLRDFYLLKFETKLSLTSSSHFLAHVLRLPVEFFGQRYGGEIGSRVLINDRVANLLAAKLGPTALDLVLVFFYAFLMLWYDGWLTVACVSLALLNLLALRLLGRRRVDSSRRLLQEKGKLTGTAMGGLQMIETLKATGGESDFFSRWAGYQAKSLMAQQDLGATTQALTVFPPLVNTVTTTVILGLGGLRVMDGHLTMGMLVAFQSLMSSFTRPINNVVTFGSSLQELEGNMNRLDDVLRYPQDPRFQRSAERKVAAAAAQAIQEQSALPEAAEAARAEARAALYAPPPRPFEEETMVGVVLSSVRNGWQAARAFVLSATPQSERLDSDAVFRRIAAGKEDTAAAPGKTLTAPDEPAAPASFGLAVQGPTLSQPPAVPSPVLQIPKLTGLVELRDVSFGYNPLEKPLIENLSLTIRPGQRVALIGGSGSGKSTVAKLVAGLYRPRSGQILFDSVPREDISNRLLSTSVGAVDQEVFFFEGTIRDNLTMWDATVPEVDLTNAVRDACIADLINSRPKSILSHVEEGGANFSGGQRQRLEIARALVTRPTFLILDEATSALDPTTEQLIDANLRRLGCSCLIVAHRLSTIRDADEILVMEAGRVVQRGTHEQMKDQEGPYAALIAQN